MPNTIDLTSLSASELAQRIARRELSSCEIVEAHIRRISTVDSKLNAVVFEQFDEARAEAARVDATLATTSSFGPLHGVPVTIKECFHVRGTPCCVGLTKHQHARSTQDGPLVTRLRAAGAIVLGKTNVPQLMFLHETDNPVYGRTNNPWNLQRTPGGSSGGEAAIIAAGGSPLGLASDLGGSIRVPSHFCGICGIKPTSGRLTKAGIFETLRGMTTFTFQPGPLARSVADLALAMSVLTGQVDSPEERDAAPSPIGGYTQIDVSRLRVGVWSSDEFFPAASSVRRGVELAVGALADAGTMVESFAPPEFEMAIGLYLGIMSADGGSDLRELLKGSAVDTQVRKTLMLARIPRAMRVPLAGCLPMIGQRRWAHGVKHSGPRSGRDVWRLARQRSQYTDRVIQLLRDRKLDAIVCPAHALPALRHGQSADVLPAACYSFWANLLEMPAGVVPVTCVQPTECQTVRARGLDLVDRTARQAELDSQGLPVGVQVIARHWREDVALAVMAAIEKAVAFPAQHPI